MKSNCTCQGSSSCSSCAASNRPGLRSIAFRAGTHASFFQAMQNRISGSDLRNAAGQLPLSALTTRTLADPAVALLDAWAAVADTLTFYQERIANEGYLRTATERRSVLALADLVGYSAKPGVSSSVFLAYTLEASSNGTVPSGSQVQSKPVGAGLPQMFETSDDLAAAGAWNNLAPRQTQPQTLTDASSVAYVSGVSTSLKPNDPLLLSAGKMSLRRIDAVEVQNTAKRTRLTLRPLAEAAVTASSSAGRSGESLAGGNASAVSASASSAADGSASASSAADGSASAVHSHAAATSKAVAAPAPVASHPGLSLVETLALSKASQPQSSESLRRTLKSTFALNSDIAPALLKTFFPEASSTLYTALRNTETAPPTAGVYAFRVQATPFGSNAPPKPITTRQGAVIGTEEWPLTTSTTTITIVFGSGPNDTISLREQEAGITNVRAGGAPHATISIATGGSTSSTELTLIAGGSVPGRVGGSAVLAALSENPTIATFTFVDLKRTFKLQLGTDAQRPEVQVTVDGAAQPISVTQGQNATVTGAAGKRTTVSFVQGISVTDISPASTTSPNVLDLDATYDQVLPGSWVVIERAGSPDPPLILQVDFTEKLTRSDYNLAIKVTRLHLKGDWLQPEDTTLAAVRNTTVLAQSEALPLAEEPIPTDVAGDEIELDGVYEGLTSGRWLVVQGMRTDIPGTSNVPAAELVMLGAVVQKAREAPPATMGMDAISAAPSTSAPPTPGDGTPQGIAAPGDSSAPVPVASADVPAPATVILKRPLLQIASIVGMPAAAAHLSFGAQAHLQPHLAATAHATSTPQPIAITQPLTANAPAPAAGAQGVASTQPASANTAAAAGPPPTPAPPTPPTPPATPPPTSSLPTDTVHTFIQLAAKLAYTYDRSSVTIAGNVVPATHGMQRKETLGSGDSSQTLQQFSLHQSPLTYTSSSTPAGATSTLAVTVNDLAWNEIDSLSNAGPTDRVFVTDRDDKDVTSITFGDGAHGMRPPTGTANISAGYRAGIGSVGNLPADQISLLASRPPGVRSVTNPIASSGGADRESIEDARTNIPLTITALDRLVSTQDYADFARSFAGISKAVSAKLSNGEKTVVAVTIAGAEAGDLQASSDLYRNLHSAYLLEGDPSQPIDISICEFMLLIIAAQIKPLPGVSWDPLAAAIRAALLDTFGFRQQQIGASVPASGVVSVIQGIPGVQYVNLTAFDALSRNDAGDPDAFARRLTDIASSHKPRTSVEVFPPRLNTAKPKARKKPPVPLTLKPAGPTSPIAPGQVAFLSADVPDTLILLEVTA